MSIAIDPLKELAVRKKSTIRVFGKLDVHFFSITPHGEVEAPVIEVVPGDRLEDFFADALEHAELFRIEGRIWQRELRREEVERLLSS